MKKKITVFTPTYNRAYILGELYESLCRQTSNDFEWVIVDDGSKDNTESLVSSFITENRILIRYFKQRNGGKYRAINKGVKEAKGEMFFIVDSDDKLSPSAVERLIYHYKTIASLSDYAGVSGIRVDFSGNRIGGNFKHKILDCSPLDLRLKYHVAGDMAEAFKLDVLKLYPFPEVENEYFCPEALVWNRLSLQYKLRYFNEGIYLCEYRPDGLTAKIVKLRMESPQLSMLYYSELYRMPISVLQKIKAAINYWRFSFSSHLSFFVHLKQIGFLSLFMYPIGLLFHLRDLRS